MDAGLGTISFGGNVNAGPNNLVLSSDNLNLGGNLTGTAALAIQPGEAGESITLGGVPGGPGLDLTTPEIGNVQSNFSSITIGRPGGTGAINVVVPLTFHNSVTIGGAGDSSPITVSGQLTMLGSTAITFASSGLLTLNAGIATTGQPINIDNSIALGGSVMLDTTNVGCEQHG